MNRWSAQNGRRRRWRERSPYQVGRSWYRVRKGIKGQDDLVLERGPQDIWVPVYMEETFMADDFLHENEQWIEQERPHWRKGGGDYYLDQLVKAVREGWEGPSEELRRQQTKRRSG